MYREVDNNNMPSTNQMVLAEVRKEWKSILSAIVMGAFVAGGLFWQISSIAEDLNEFKQKVPPESVAVLKNDVQNIKQDVNELKNDTKEIRRLVEKLVINGRKE